MVSDITHRIRTTKYVDCGDFQDILRPLPLPVDEISECVGPEDEIKLNSRVYGCEILKNIDSADSVQ